MAIVKTQTGHQVMKDRSVPLTPRQRSAFILFDGKRTLAQVLAATAPAGVTREDVDKLFELGLLAHDAGEHPGKPAPAAVPSGDDKERTAQERYAQAYPVATRLTAALGLRGFRLNLAVEGATSYEQLLEVAPRIRDAVGPEKYGPLESALKGH
jgi:hypothetical protein